MHKGGHERRFYPNAPLLQTPPCHPPKKTGIGRSKQGLYPMLSRNSLRAALNCSGASRFDRWPALGRVTTRPPAILLATVAPTSGVEMPPSSPPTTRVGTP